MKKCFIILCCSMFLFCGCGETENHLAAGSADESDHVDVQVEEDNSVTFSSISEFLSSDFCNTMQSAGYTPYVLSYDTEKYELVSIRCDSRFYEFSLLEKDTGGSIIYCVTYDAYFKNVEEIAALYVDEPEKNLITSVEKDGSVFDVHVSRIPSPDVSSYNLSYLPFEGYMVYIGTDSPTPEEAIAYIHEFDLVAAE